MKSPSQCRTGGWLSRKLAKPSFRRGFEEELQKLAIGEQLTRLRLKAGMTQTQVARRAKTTASAISRYENADYDRYELRTLQRIVRACGGRMVINFTLSPKGHRAA
jgi:DNA-binding XRE family transcriptional regulator